MFVLVISDVVLTLLSIIPANIYDFIIKRQFVALVYNCHIDPNIL